MYLPRGVTVEVVFYNCYDTYCVLRGTGMCQVQYAIR